jgi:carboxyl-terminal processing protease
VAELRRDHDRKIGYLRLSQFNGNAATEMATAIRQLSRQGAEGFVLDLRNNPGGLLQAGIAIARQWIDNGPIVYTVNRQGVFDTFEATGDALTHQPLVVLVNRGTASASEILAGALQDSGRAQLVGERTFGKGLIQSLFDLADGSGLAVTIAKYETPLHRDINQAGIEPDRAIDGPPPPPIGDRSAADRSDPQYDAALQALVAQLPSTVAAHR